MSSARFRNTREVAAAALLAALLGTPTLAHAQEKSMPEQIADVLVQLSGGILGR